MKRQLTCTEVLEIVSASLDGEASVPEIDAAASHLLACPTCQREAEAMEADDVILRRPPAERVQPVLQPRMAPVWPWAAAAALVAALTVVGFLLLNPTEIAAPETTAALDQRLDQLTVQLTQQLAADAQPAPATGGSPGGHTNPFRDRKASNPFANLPR